MDASKENLATKTVLQCGDLMGAMTHYLPHSGKLGATAAEAIAAIARFRLELAAMEGDRRRAQKEAAEKAA